MKAGKPAALFAAIMMLVSVIFGESVPILQNFILKNNEIKEIDVADKTSEVSLKKGDYVYFGKYREEPVLWKVLDVRSGEPLLMTEYIICFKSFDSCGENKKYHSSADTEKYGSSDWNSCNLKEWLNSSEVSVRYSHCPPDEDGVYYGQNAYADECGFLYEQNFSSRLKSMISDEGVLILTAKELKEYFNNETRRRSCTASALINSDSPYLITTSEKLWYWTSSPVSSNNVSVAAVTSSGSFYKTLAYDSMAGVCPSLYLKSTSVPVSSGNGSKKSPFAIS